MSKKGMIFIIIILVWSSSLWASTYYLDAIDGSDDNPGTSEQPWQTLTKSKASTTSGDTIKVRNGNYGTFSLSMSSNNTDWITYEADTGEDPNFEKIYIYSSEAQTERNAYYKFDGIDIIHPNWTPASGDDGDYHADDSGAPGYFFFIQDVNYVQISNATCQGYYMWISKCGRINRAKNITINHCDMNNFNEDGVYIGYSQNITVQNCYIHKMVQSTPLRSLNGSTNVLLENNHINKETTTIYESDEPYYPHWFCETDPNWDGHTTVWLHNGSGIGVRTSNTTIRKNIVHGLFSQGLYFYTDAGPYHDNVVENNLFYDTRRVPLYQLTTNIVVRNNTFIGLIQVPELGYTNILQRYQLGAYLSTYAYSGYDLSGVHVYNNIGVGYCPYSSGSTVDGDYNIFWARESKKYGGKGPHTITAVWRDNDGTGDFHGYPNYFEDIGFRGSTDEYSYSEDGIQPFFVNPGFDFGPKTGYADCFQIWDYHLVEGSPAINFGDPNNQPSDSLGTLGDDGFIVDDGPARDADHHSAGCYEYSEAEPPAPENHAPVLASVGSKSVKEENLLEFTVSATDEDEDDLYYQCNPIVDGATFDGDTQTFSWTPEDDESGIYYVTFIVSDGEYYDSEEVQITVTDKKKYLLLYIKE